MRLRRTNSAGPWVGSLRAAALLECAPQTVRKVAAAGGVRVRHLPGMPYPQYHREDLERVLRDSMLGTTTDAA